MNTLVRFNVIQEVYDTAIQHPIRLMGEAHTSANAYRTITYQSPRSIDETIRCPGGAFYRKHKTMKLYPFVTQQKQ
jgi:hypothetical protein